MSSVAVIRSLLAASTAVTNVIPATKILAGDIQINTVMPAISVKQISGVSRNTVGMNGSKVMHTDRVQVSYLFKGPQGTPAGAGYPGVKAMGRLVLTACANTHGTINGVDVDSILPVAEGPDLSDMETALYSQSRDFVVKWRS